MNYLIPFAQCAPIQIAGFGMHGTTGTEEVGYFLSSKYLEPAHGDEHYTEKLVQCEELPTWQDHLEKEKFQATRNEFSLPEKGAIYFCPHRLPKFHPDFDRFLRDILETDSKGYLVMLDNGNKSAMAKLRSRWERTLGKSLMSRILMRPQMWPLDYYKMISASSCVLDSPCYSTSFTGFDTLAMGVPLIGLQGNLMVQRYASAFYKRMDLEEFIPQNRKEYVTLAVTVANDRDFRRNFLDLLDERKEVLFENHRAIHHFTEALERIHAETFFSG
jgi:predicted O-linked N-acetylglucosamine transferase (SPINDLY family)